MRFGRSKDKGVLVQCPYATEGSKDFCSEKKPFVLDMTHPDFKETMEAHVQMHVERDSSLLGLTIKRFACPVCDWVSKPFQSNNSTQIHALGKEELDAMIDFNEHMDGSPERVANLEAVPEAERGERPEDFKGHVTCDLHETPGHEILVYYFRDAEEKAIHVKMLHTPKVRPVNAKIKGPR